MNRNLNNYFVEIRNHKLGSSSSKSSAVEGIELNRLKRGRRVSVLLFDGNRVDE